MGSDWERHTPVGAKWASGRDENWWETQKRHEKVVKLAF